MLYLHGIGHFHPETIITNSFLEELDIDTNSAWILERVGIKERRSVLPLDYIKLTKNLDMRQAQEASMHTNAQTGAYAAKMAIDQAQIQSSDIGLLISGSCTPQHCCPAESATIAAHLEMDVVCFDLNSACSTLAAQLHFLNMMASTELPDYVLLVQPENNTRNVNYSERSSAVLWGDCSTALIVSAKHPSAFEIKHTFLESNPKGWDKVLFPKNDHFKQEGRTVQTFAIKKSLMIIERLKTHINPLQWPDTKFIGHQANLNMLQSVCLRSEISASQHFYNVDQFGNCGAAGAASVLSQNIHQLKSKDQVMVGVVGAGLSWGGFLLEVQS